MVTATFDTTHWHTYLESLTAYDWRLNSILQETCDLRQRPDLKGGGSFNLSTYIIRLCDALISLNFWMISILRRMLAWPSTRLLLGWLCRYDAKLTCFQME